MAVISFCQSLFCSAATAAHHSSFAMVKKKKVRWMSVKAVAHSALFLLSCFVQCIYMYWIRSCVQRAFMSFKTDFCILLSSALSVSIFLLFAFIIHFFLSLFLLFFVADAFLFYFCMRYECIHLVFLNKNRKLRVTMHIASMQIVLKSKKIILVWIKCIKWKWYSLSVKMFLFAAMTASEFWKTCCVVWTECMLWR